MLFIDNFKFNTMNCQLLMKCYMTKENVKLLGWGLDLKLEEMGLKMYSNKIALEDAQFVVVVNSCSCT